jgi:hypothetical protein
MNEDCTILSCPVPKIPAQDYLNQYSLEGNKLSLGNISVFIPSINVPAITYEGCSGPISIAVPSGSTAAQVQAIAQQVLQLAVAQQAACDAASTAAAPVLRNARLTIPSGCQTLHVTGNLFPGLSVSGNDFILNAGLFSSDVSQADANQVATTFAQNWINNLFATGGAFCGPLPPSTLLIGLMAYYKLDEISGNRQSAVGNYPMLEATGDFITPGSVTSASGKIGKAAYFPNPNTYLTTIANPNPTALFFTGSFTVNLWVKAPDTYTILFARFLANESPIYNWYPGQWGFSGQWGFYTTANTSSGFEVTETVTPLVGSALEAGNYTDGTWHMATLICDLANSLLVVYRDGVFFNSTPTGGVIVPVGDLTAPTSTQIGNNYSSDVGMMIDEVGFWSRVLTPAEVWELYNSGAGLTYPF